MQATGSVTWVIGAQASVLGRCSGGGVPYPSSSSAPSGRFQGSGAVRCCVQAQTQERKPRVRKTKEERRELVESFVNTYWPAPYLSLTLASVTYRFECYMCRSQRSILTCPFWLLVQTEIASLSFSSYRANLLCLEIQQPDMVVILVIFT